MRVMRFLEVLIVLSLMVVPTLAHTESDPFYTDLVVGRGATDIGDVLVWNDATNVYVKYVITDTNWRMTQVHTDMGAALTDIATNKNGLPNPGKFDYGQSLDYVLTYTENRFANSWAIGTNLFVAAHANVFEECGIISLPDSVTTVPKSGSSQGWFDIILTGGSGDLPSGTYPGFCGDPQTDIYANHVYTADVYSSYEEILSDCPEYPWVLNLDNLDQVNYILNHYYVGMTDAYGTYYWYDIQQAIWTVLEGQCDPRLACRPLVAHIVSDAQANGEGFIPECGQKLVILLVPYTPDSITHVCGQPMITWISRPCDFSCNANSAWARDPSNVLYFNEPSSWATYFRYVTQ